MSQAEIARDAIQHAYKALRKRHLLEEGAHAPAFAALSRPFQSQASEWKEKAENLEVELQQCYKAQSRLSEQLVVEVAECRTSKSLIHEKDILISDLKKELAQARKECSQAQTSLEEKTKGLELLICENQELRAELEVMRTRVKDAEAENKMLVDRWMLQKMNDAERINEANALYEDMVGRLKSAGIEQIAGQQADGIIRQSEDGAEFFMGPTVPTACAQKITAHQGGCASLLFLPHSAKLISGGQDRCVKAWDTNTGNLSTSFHGCLGSVLDLAITHDSNSIIAASSSNNLYVWDAGSGRMKHTLTGHADKVCAVDASRVSSRHAVSAAYDRTLKSWDLLRGYCTNTIMCHSNCNALSFAADGRTLFSGHADGNLRMWDLETGRLVGEVAAHSGAVTSLSLSRTGTTIVTSGRDDVHNVFEVGSLEACGRLRASGNRVASNWSRSCLSSDEGLVAAGSADGCVYVWSLRKGVMVGRLREHVGPVLCCAWSGLGKPLASSDKNGIICVWT